MIGPSQDKQQRESSEESVLKGDVLIDGLDYYIDVQSGYLVMTAHYLRKRGQCCGNGCRHCPYVPRHGGGSASLGSNHRG